MNILLIEMIVLACTGGIGSGKTYISKLFIQLGIPAYFSDDRTKELYDSDSELLSGMEELLGGDIISGGRLRRDIVAERIFCTPQLLLSVEELVHPVVMRDFCRWKDEIQRKGFADGGGKIKIPPFVVFESAIILEKPAVRKIADKVMTVSAPLEVRLKRIMERDKVDEIEAHRRLDIQWSDAKREALADFIIDNDNVTPLLPQVERVYLSLQ